MSKIQIHALVSYAVTVIVVVWGVLALAMPMSLMPDSLYYIHGSTSLRQNGSYAFPEADNAVVPITDYPPGFSFVAAVLCGLFGIQAVLAFKIVNVFALVPVGVLLVLLSRKLRSRPLLFVLLMSVAVSHYWYYATNALSDMMYIGIFYLVLIQLYALAVGKDTSHSWIQWVAISVVVASSVLVRYVGLSLIPIVLLAYYYKHKVSWRSGQALSVIGLLAIMVAPFALWNLRNAMLGGDLNAVSRIASAGPSIGYDVIVQYIHTFYQLSKSFILGSILVPPGLAQSIWSDLLIAIVIGYILMGVKSVFRSMQQRESSAIVLGGFIAVALTYMIVVVFAFTVVHVAKQYSALAAGQSFQVVYKIPLRYVWFLSPLMSMIIVYSYDLSFRRGAVKYYVRYWRYVVYAMAIVMVIMGARSTYTGLRGLTARLQTNHVDHLYDPVYGDSPVVRHLSSHGSRSVYTNGPGTIIGYHNPGYYASGLADLLRDKSRQDAPHMVVISHADPKGEELFKKYMQSSTRVSYTLVRSDDRCALYLSK